MCNSASRRTHCQPSVSAHRQRVPRPARGWLLSESHSSPKTVWLVSVGRRQVGCSVLGSSSPSSSTRRSSAPPCSRPSTPPARRLSSSWFQHRCCRWLRHRRPTRSGTARGVCPPEPIPCTTDEERPASKISSVGEHGQEGEETAGRCVVQKVTARRTMQGDRACCEA
jgi:hypothetical protein